MFQITTPTEVKLCSMTPRTEKHGDEDVSAVSLSLRMVGPNTMLDILQPGLRDALYKAVEGQEQLPGVEPSTPLLRSRGIESVKLTACFEGWTLAIDQGIDETTPIKLGGSKIDRFVVEPKEGGSIELTFRVGSSDIDETEAGWLFGHLGQQIVVTVAAPEVKAPAIDGSTEAFQADHPDAGSAADLFAAEHGGDGSDVGQSDAGDDDDDQPAADDDLEAGLRDSIDQAGLKPKRQRRAAGVH